MKLRPGFFLLLLAFASCKLPGSKKKNTEKNQDEKFQLMEVDRAFSKLCADSGTKVAFLKYIDNEGVLLRSGHPPLQGGDAIDAILQGDDANSSLSWQPKGCMLAESGELGFTYGIYQSAGKDTGSIAYGTYVSIWRRQPDGGWKFVLDSGNEGLGDETTE